jgi:serine/threonine-protein kinase
VKHQISERVEALKVLLPDLAKSPDLADRFIREIRVQARLNHPNIASLHNAFHLNNQLLMVMEYIEGLSLYLRLKQGPLSLWHGVNIVSQILSALSYAHAHGVVHRDVKPANIMLTSEGIVKLMDFGIARSVADKNLTQAGFAVGSAYYMSPEQVRGLPADARSDIYSVAVTLFELVTGSRPFGGEGTYEIMSAHVTTTPPDPSSINAGVPPGLSAAILKALEKNPDRRFQSCDEFCDALQRLVNIQFGTANPAGMMETIPYLSGSPAGPIAQTPNSASIQRTTGLKERAATPPTPTAGAKTDVFSEERVEALRRDLAQYVGPVARVLVDRALKRSTTWKAVYEFLSSEVPAGKERDRFLASRPRS